LNEEPYELPLGWIWVKLGEVGTIVGGGTPRRDNPGFYEDGIIPWATPTDIDPKEILIISKTAEKITEEAVRGSSARVLPVGTVLFSSRASVGKIAIAGTKLATNQGFANIIPATVLGSKYLAYGLRNFAQDIERLGSGTTYLEVAKSSLKEFYFPFAPLNEQRRIVSKIEGLFAENKTVREALGKVPILLRRFRQSVLAKAFRGELIRGDPNDEPARKPLRRIEQHKQKTRRKLNDKENQNLDIAENLPDLPEQWTYASADELSSQITDGEHITPKRQESGIYLLSARNVLDGRLALEDVDFISTEEHKRIKKRLNPEPGDVLLTCSGSVGRTCVVPKNRKFSMVRSVALIKPVKDLVDGEFMSFALRSDILQSQIERKKTQTAQANIFQGKIRTLIFPLAPINEQRQIVSRIKELFSWADHVEAAVNVAMKNVDRIDQAILNKAFRGKLVPQDPGDEPASVLLQRIKAGIVQQTTSQRQLG